MTQKDVKRFKEIKARLKDLRQCHGDDIEAGSLLRMSTVVITESEWLAKQLDLALKNKPVEEDVEEPETAAVA